MQISISGQHIAMGNALQDYVRERLPEVVQKYLKDAISANIHFSKQGFQFVCDIMVNDGTGRHMVIKSNALSDEIYHSFNLALVKLEKQLRRYKSRLTTRHHRVKVSEDFMIATKYVISPYLEEEEEGGHPTIIAEKAIDVLTLTVSEAIMKMDLENLPAIMFRNSKSLRMNIVYYRRDGNISWVDSTSLE